MDIDHHISAVSELVDQLADRLRGDEGQLTVDVARDVELIKHMMRVALTGPSPEDTS